MPHPTWIKKHPLLTGVLVMFVMSSLWIGYFLASFDLNDYRGDLQGRLEERLGLPVHLGKAQLRLRDAGIAITFNDVTIGNGTSAFALESHNLWLLFEWSALFRQELRFSKIGVLQPTVRLANISPNHGTPTENGFIRMFAGSHAVLEGLSIQSLEIRDGRFLLLPPPDQEGAKPISFESVDTHLGHFALGQTTRLTLTATLLQEGQPAQVNITGTAALPDRFEDWMDTRLDINADLTHLDSTIINQVPALTLSGFTCQGKASLENRAVGSVAEGLRFSSKLTAEPLTLSGPALPAPYPIRHFQADGTFSKKGDRYQLRNVSAQLDGVRLTGDISLQQDEQRRWLELQLTQGVLPLASLPEALQLHQESPWLPSPEGSLWLERGQVKIGLGTDKRPVVTLDKTQFTGTVQNLTWQPVPGAKLSLDSLRFDSAGPLWTLSDGRGSLGSTSLQLQGVVDLSDVKAPDLDLSLAGTAQPGDLLPLLGKQSAPDLAISGAIPFLAELQGPLAQLNLDLEARLDAMALTYAESVRRPPTPGGLLQVHGLLTRQRLDVEHAHLQLSPASGRVSGRVDWSEQPAIALQGFLEVTDTSALQQIMPSLDKLHLSGGANLEFSLNGPFQQLEHRAVLTLHDIGISMHGIIADISKLQGKVHLSRTGLESEEMMARIGNSPVSFAARLTDLTAPNLILDIRADQVRADELIFYSDQILLHDLKSRLEIAPGKVAFTSAQVRLPNGTQAQVTGQVTSKPHVKVELDITSEFANIEEVIGLWSHLSPEAREARRNRRPTRVKARKPYEVIINARADKGDLYGMHFQNAVGTIIQKPGQLTIHPLDFTVDKGRCTAQVIVDFNQDKPSLMRISGHAQDVDAYRIYNELLKQNGILMGSLSGDFYLQGEIGKTYLPSSFGSFDVEIKDGVLRKFHVLSKIFSLLNVSQLFALKLPDMDLEGMPYDTINGSLVMKNGILSSEKLLVKSEAMNQSYIGQLDLVEKKVDFTLAIQPLRTVDKILSRIPIAGWLLTGEEKALITTHFAVKGALAKPEVSVQPVTSISEKTLGLIRRTLGLPVKLVTDPSILWGSGTGKE